MSRKELPEHVIPKEKAVFWLDGRGFWHTAEGKFENRNIINHFHSCIRKDANGYYLRQEHSEYREKVYFLYEDTALFVVHILKDGDIILVLNTGKKVKLKPKKLFIKNECLYMMLGEERAKFSEEALLRITDYMEDEAGQFFIRINGKKYQIPEKE
ncbi:MAG: MFS transporter permease [Deltaproteobacteria bacterium]|nr:MFS transporter permease [Deltaproteobacteria bacterium]